MGREPYADTETQAGRIPGDREGHHRPGVRKKCNYLEVAVEAPKDVLVLRGEVYEQNNPRPALLSVCAPLRSL